MIKGNRYGMNKDDIQDTLFTNINVFSLKVYIVVYVCFICVSSRDCGPQLPSVDQHWSVFRDGHVGDERLVLLLDPRHTTPTLQFQLKSGGGLLERYLPPRLVYSASLSF